MAGLWRRSGGCAALMLWALAGCVAWPSTSPEAPSAVVTGPAIEVTALPPVAEAAAMPARTLAPTPEAVPSPVTAPTPAAASDPASKAAPDAASASVEAQAEPAAAPVITSAGQRACLAKKGHWMAVGGGMSACVQRTKDSLKSCHRAQDCSSLCLARSNTCAPYQPMFGCHEVLDQMGRRMTQCLN